MNLALTTNDSGGVAKAKIDKTFLIQNLFPRPRTLGIAPEIFLNYLLDSNLSPKRRAAPVERGDDHPQPFEKTRKVMPCLASA